MDEREIAQQEAREAMEAASVRVDRARVFVETNRRVGDVIIMPGDKIDVTEDVVSVLDAAVGSLDWGSGFFDDDQITAISRLARLLGFTFVGSEDDYDAPTPENQLGQAWAGSRLVKPE